MVVVAIIGIFAALAGTAYVYGTRRAQANNLAFEVMALASAAQTRATASGRPQYLVFTATVSTADVVLVEKADPPPAWSSVDLADPSSWGGTVVDRRRLESGVSFMPLNPPPVRALVGGLPPPFAAVPVAAAGGSTALGPACSFCAAGSGGEVGAIRFSPDGSASVATAPAAAGGVVALGSAGGPNSPAEVKVVAISVPGGVVRLYQ